MKKLLVCVCGIAAAFVLAAQAPADVIVYYSFTNATSTADTGSSISTLTYSHTGTSANSWLSGTTVNAQPGFVAGNAIGMNGWDGDASYFQFTLDASLWHSNVVSWASNRSSTGPPNVILKYSTNGVGGTFYDFATYTVTTTAALFGPADFSTTPGLDYNANVVFRLVGTGTTATGGTMKVDNFTIVAIPEPSTIMLIGVGLLGLLALRHRS